MTETLKSHYRSTLSPQLLSEFNIVIDIRDNFADKYSRTATDDQRDLPLRRRRGKVGLVINTNLSPQFMIPFLPSLSQVYNFIAAKQSSQCLLSLSLFRTKSSIWAMMMRMGKPGVEEANCASRVLRFKWKVGSPLKTITSSAQSQSIEEHRTTRSASLLYANDGAVALARNQRGRLW